MMISLSTMRGSHRIIRTILIMVTVAFVIVCIPAAWLFGRDMLGLQLASSPEHSRRLRNAIFDGLIYEVERADVVGSGTNPVSATSFDQPCYTIPISSVQRDEHFLPSAVSKDGNYDISSQIIGVRVAATFHARRTARLLDAQAKFTVSTASALRACIAATPFSKNCLNYTNRMLGQSGEAFDQQAIMWGLKIPVRTARDDRHQRYCDAVPLFVGPASE